MLAAATATVMAARGERGCATATATATDGAHDTGSVAATGIVTVIASRRCRMGRGGGGLMPRPRPRRRQFVGVGRGRGRGRGRTQAEGGATGPQPSPRRRAAPEARLPLPLAVMYANVIVIVTVTTNAPWAKAMARASMRTWLAGLPVTAAEAMAARERAVMAAATLATTTRAAPPLAGTEAAVAVPPLPLMRHARDPALTSAAAATGLPLPRRPPRRPSAFLCLRSRRPAAGRPGEASSQCQRPCQRQAHLWRLAPLLTPSRRQVQATGIIGMQHMSSTAAAGSCPRSPCRQLPWQLERSLSLTVQVQARAAAITGAAAARGARARARARLVARALTGHRAAIAALAA